eukprot:1185347-Prorocentrum_minimum.AAC.1
MHNTRRRRRRRRRRRTLRWPRCSSAQARTSRGLRKPPFPARSCCFRGPACWRCWPSPPSAGAASARYRTNRNRTNDHSTGRRNNKHAQSASLAKPKPKPNVAFVRRCSGGRGRRGGALGGLPAPDRALPGAGGSLRAARGGTARAPRGGRGGPARLRCRAQAAAALAAGLPGAHRLGGAGGGGAAGGPGEHGARPARRGGAAGGARRPGAGVTQSSHPAPYRTPTGVTQSSRYGDCCRPATRMTMGQARALRGSHKP